MTTSLTSVEVENIRRDEPWCKILTDWEKTAPNRRNNMTSLGVAKTITRWPKYKNKHGFQFVSILSNYIITIVQYLLLDFFS